MLIASRVEQLTGLRFLAALGVLLCHFHVLAPYMGAKFLFDLGGHGVTLFFVLSGFVLTWRYDAPWREHAGPNGASDGAPRVDVAAFAAARFARIAPVYWLALALTLLAYLATGAGVALGPPPADAAEGAAGLVVNALALQAWVPSEHVQQFWNAPGWSISAEFFFYACFPWLLRQRWLSGSAVSFALVMLVFSVLLGLYLAVLWASGLWGATGLAFAARVPLLGLLPFVVGMLCCRLLRRKPHWRHHQGGWTLLALALLTASAWAADAWAPPQAVLLHMLLVSYGVYVPLFALLIVCLALDNGPLARGLRSPVLVLLGNASYALYLLHWLPLGVALWWLGPEGAAPLAGVLAGVAGLVALSVLVYRWFEAPLRLHLVATLGRGPNVSQVA